MAKGPDEDDVESFAAVTSLPRINATEWLKAHNNDVERAVNAWMDNPTPMPPKSNSVRWNESEFHADKTGEGFSVHPPDTLTPGVFAPSRPPSRASNPAAGPAGGKAQSHFEDTDDEMSRALAMSLSDSQTLPGQETGVTDFNKTTFGPAQRDEYDASQWTMTVPGTHTQEILLNPEPLDRKRQPGAPAFFKPSSDNHRLSALLKIAHEIPVAREALLNRSYPRKDYGHNNEWWDGQAIKILKVVNLDHQQQDSYGQDLLHETQRLMAFLERTERAYGSVDVLMNLLGPDMQEDRMHKFLKDWYNVTGELAPKEHIGQIFKSRGIKKDPISGMTLMDQEFYCLSIGVEPHLADRGMSLYDALDEIIWLGSENHDVFLKDVADVFVLEVNNSTPDSSSLGIDIPASWYIDRYLESSRIKAKEMLGKKSTIYEELGRLDQKQQNLLHLQKPMREKIDASRLITKASSFFEETTSYLDESDENASIESMSISRSKEITEELKRLSDRISTKLNSFENLRQDAQDRLREISQFYTKPTDDPTAEPTHGYTLRGVATIPQTMYVLEKTQPDNEDDILSSEAKDWQWWKLEYVSIDQKPVVTTKVSEAQVLQAARAENNSALLVYASDQAISHPTLPLSPALENFVRADNLSFSAELNQFIQPLESSPSKRKAADSDSDDMITQHSHTPPLQRDFNQDEDDDNDENNSIDLNLPDNSPTRRSKPRPIRPKGGSEEAGSIFKQQSSDSLIPLSLQDNHVKHADHLDLDLSSDEQEQSPDQDMQEKALKGNGGSTRPTYSLGSYVPEINMEDDDEDGDDAHNRDERRVSQAADAGTEDAGQGTARNTQPQDGIEKQGPQTQGQKKDDANAEWQAEPRGRGSRDDFW